MDIPYSGQESGADILGLPARGVGARFIAGYVIAQTGAFLAFLPLLSILVPVKVQAVAPGQKAAILGELLVYGALTASIANYIGGALSDRTLARFGRRRPWMVLGALGVALSYGLIETAHGYWGLLAGVVAFQFLFNLMFAPLTALLADRVPERQKGRVVGLLSLAAPAASIIGALLAGQFLLEGRVRYGSIAALILAAVIPFALFAERGPRIAVRESGTEPGTRSPRLRRDMAVLWMARFFGQTANAVYVGFLLFFFHDVIRYGAIRPGHADAEGLANQTIVYTVGSVAAAVLIGYASDRWGGRKRLALLASLLMAAAFTTLALSSNLTGATVAGLLMGAGFGGYCAMDSTLGASLVSGLKSTGRSLGVLNLAYTLPQAFAPGAAALLLASGHSYRLLYGLAAGLALLGGLTIQFVRGRTRL